MPLCDTIDLSKSAKGGQYLFGFNRLANGTDRIYSAAGALAFGGNYSETYRGRETVRGILADKWTSCVYWSDLDSTMTVDWYFSGIEKNTLKD